MNMQLRELIEALTRQLDQSMPTAQTNVSGFFRNNTTGEIVLQGELSNDERSKLLDEIDELKGDMRDAASDRDYADNRIDDLKEKLRWAESEVDRLQIERRALMS